VSLRGYPHPFWILLLVFSPSGPQGRDSLIPGLVRRINSVDLGPVIAASGGAVAGFG
jgi:hypothetical protein